MGNESKQELIHRLIELVDSLNREYHVEALEEWRGIDMTIPQIKTLVLLHNTDQMRMTGIAKYLGTTLSASTNIIDRLVDKGLVERASDPDDRRVVICKLTGAGQQTVNKFWSTGSPRVELMALRLNFDQLKLLVEAFEMISNEVKEFYKSNDPHHFSGNVAPPDSQAQTEPEASA